MLYFYIPIVILNIILGSFPLLKFQKNLAYIGFSAASYGLAFWIFCVYMFWHYDPILSGRLAFFGGTFGMWGALSFTLYYPQPKSFINPKKLKMITLFSIVMLGLSQTPLILETVIENHKVIYGPLYPIFILHYLIYTLFIVFNVFQGTIILTGLNKIKMKYVAIGITIPIMSGAIFNLFLPVLGINKFNNLGPLSSSIGILFCLYAILKHRLMDIQVVIKKSAATIIALTIYLSIGLILQHSIQPITMPIETGILFLYWSFATLTFSNFRLWLQSTAENTFLKGNINHTKLLEKSINTLSTCSRIEQVIETISSILKTDLQITHFDLYLPKDIKNVDGQSPIIPWDIHTKTPLSNAKNTLKDFVLPELLLNPEIIDIADTTEIMKQKLILENIRLIIPLSSNQQTIGGFIALAEKASEDAYTVEDISFFKTLSTQVAIVIDRLKPFEAIRASYLNSLEIAEKESQRATHAQLTAGIAHEIRNPLGIILSAAELIIAEPNNPELIKRTGEAIEEVTLRLSNITTTMLRYAKPVSPHQTDINVTKILQDLIILSQAECKKRQIQLSSQLDPLPTISGDEASLSQAFLNILLNAMEACTQEKAKVMIEGGLGTFYTVTGTSVPAIVIKFIDTGTGFSPDIKSKLFDPFFTTKYGHPGLGLPNALKIIQEHGGSIQLRRENNQTIAVCYIPQNQET